MPSNPDQLLGFGWVAEIEWGSKLSGEIYFEPQTFFPSMNRMHYDKRSLKWANVLE